MQFRSHVVAAAVLLLAGCASEPAPSVAILEPADGATLSNPVTVRFGVSGMAVAPAGTMEPKTGHHHLLIDVGPIAAGSVVPASPQHLHYGAGQTEAKVTLAPGTRKLTAQFANGLHESYGPAMSRTITVTVK
jgi:PBP1b-binding outer membrane lipoprotein LpoB